MGSLDDPHAVITVENSVLKEPMYPMNSSQMYKQSKVDVSMRFVDGVNDPSTVKRRNVPPG